MTAKMTQAEALKSARKRFMVTRLKVTVLQILNIEDDKVDAELEKLLKPLTKTFGAEVATEILNEAIDAAGDKFGEIMDAGMKQIMSNKKLLEEIGKEAAALEAK